jgi:hypothetical protein
MGALIGGLALAAEDRGSLRVFLFDYAGVSPTVLQGAKDTASVILDRAGVAVEWADCSVGGRGDREDSACDGFTPLDIQLRLLNSAMARRVGTTRNCLGYAVIGDGFGSVAGVYFRRAIDLESEGVAFRSQILGAAMAHEIGHLVLAEARHSPAGLMRAQWDKSDLKAVGRGRLGFDHSQARHLVFMAQKRAQERARRAPANRGMEEARSASGTVLP